MRIYMHVMASTMYQIITARVFTALRKHGVHDKDLEVLSIHNKAVRVSVTS